MSATHIQSAEQVATNSLLNKRELAARLGVHPRTVDNLLAKGAIPVIRLTPKLVRFNLAAVMARLQEAA